MANLNLREEEFQFLENFYSVPEQEDKVFYKDLVEEVETVFTLKSLEKDPLLRPGEYKIPDFLNPDYRLNKQENEFLDQTMRKLALLVRKYRVDPKSFFKDADRANIGIIASSKFSSILSVFRLNVNEKEMNILIKRFCGKSMIEINYYDFNDCLKKYVSMIEEEKEREEEERLLKQEVK